MEELNSQLAARLYLSQVLAGKGNVLILIQLISDFIKKGVITWEEIDITPEKLLKIANDAYSLRYSQLKAEEGKIDACFSEIQEILLQSRLSA